MSGVIMEDGTQWERCNGCGGWVKIELLCYALPTEKYEYGLDLCNTCMDMHEEEPEWFDHMQEALKQSWEHGKRVGADEVKRRHKIIEPGDEVFTFS